MKTVIRPEAEMKDSGIDWIGSMPINWKVVRISSLQLLSRLPIAPSQGLQGFEQSA